MTDSSDSITVDAAAKDHPRENYPQAFGNYLLLQRLARGGMGEVYFAKSGGLAGIEKHCVVKTLRSHLTTDREYVTRFIDEARVVVQLAHRNIAQVFDVGRVGKQYYLAMEFIAGSDVRTTLEQVRETDRNIPENVALHIVSEVLEALDYAHRYVDPVTGQRLNLVHRDVSPQNMMISFEGEVKLIDFGLAVSTMKIERTQPNVVMGKMAYMSPEQARGEPIDGRTDVFAAAVVCYELLVGERYYEGLSFNQIYSIVGNGGYRPQKWDQLHPELAPILGRGLEAAAADRYASAADFKDALVEYMVSRRLRPVSRELREMMKEVFGHRATQHHQLIARYRNVSALSSQTTASKKHQRHHPGDDIESFIEGAPIPDRATGSEVIPFRRPVDRTYVSLADPTIVADTPSPHHDTDHEASSGEGDTTDEGGSLPELPTLIQPGAPQSPTASSKHPDLIDRSDRRRSSAQDPTFVVRDSRSPGRAVVKEIPLSDSDSTHGDRRSAKWLAILAGVAISLTGITITLFFALDGLGGTTTSHAAAPTGSQAATGQAAPVRLPAHAPDGQPKVPAGSSATRQDAEGEKPDRAEASEPRTSGQPAPVDAPSRRQKTPTPQGRVASPTKKDADASARVSSTSTEKAGRNDRAKRRRSRRSARAAGNKLSTRRPAAATAPASTKPKLSASALREFKADGLKVWDFLKQHCQPIVRCAQKIQKPNMLVLKLDELKRAKKEAIACAEACKRKGR